ncbi:MAG: TonB-dependent receptor [Gelidibacter sp.]
MKTFMNSLLLLVFLIPSVLWSQTQVSGTVTEEANALPVPGVNIIIKGTATGTTTDFDGNYSISVRNGEVVVFSYVGFKPQEIIYNGQPTLNVALIEEAAELAEIVLIGYGSVKKEDATGSVTAVTAKDFNKGPVVSSDQLIQGRISGVQVISGGGSPGEGAQIRIRSGSSLSANNDPLYIIDGVPVENGGAGITGGRSPLTTVNQNDIESITVLKDASATAIYGVRASNGVVIITTKKGKKGDLNVTYNGTYSISTLTDKVDVLTGDQIRNFVINSPDATAGQIALLGRANTDWQDVIYRDAFGTDHSVAASGGFDKFIYRASVGYSNYDGILKRDNFERTTLSANFIVDLWDDHIKIEVNNKTTLSQNDFSNRGAVGNAISMDPTQNIYDSTSPYGGFFQWLNPNNRDFYGNPKIHTLVGASNPLALIEQNNNFGRSFRSIGNLKLDYKLHFLPELKATANIGYDFIDGRNYGYRDRNFAGNPIDTAGNIDIGNYSGKENKENRLLDLYLNYNKTIEDIATNIDVTAGYSYQDFRYPFESFRTIGGVEQIIKSENRLNLQAFFGRANFSIANKYLLTATIRADGSSRFSEDNRWGYFPSAAFSWKMHEEGFIKNLSVVSEFKPRISWGITGQQDVGGLYPALALYLPATNTAAYQFGYNPDGTPYFITPVRPQPYNSNLQWEQTETYNLGLDFGLFSNRITGSIDAYRRETTKLLNFVPNPQGVGFSNADNYNIGSLENKGIEFSADVFPIRNDDIRWRIGGNMTFQKSKITQLTLVDDPNYQGVLIGGISGAVGNTIQNHQVGFSPYSFLVYEQAFNASGQPLEGVYIDRNGDGIINSNDLYRYRKPSPDVYYGFNTDITYKNWDFSAFFRGSWGNYNYNNVDSSKGYSEAILGLNEALFNAVPNLLETNFEKPQYFSDYYVQDASFLKMDNATIGYTFSNIFGENSTMKVSGTVQNVFTITDYKGIDPETTGIDNNLYPRPRTYLIGFNVNF